MKGLLYKEWATLTSSYKQTVFFIAFLYGGISILTGQTGMAYALLVVFSILITSTISFDENSHWDIYARTLPVTPAQLVGSKYLFGLCGLALGTVCTVLIVLLISAMLAVGVRFAVRTYRESMELSETELLCSTLTAAISDKLRYSGEVGQNMFIQGVGTTDSGGGGSFAISDDGEVVIQTTDSEEFRLLGSASYPQGLRVRTTGTGETGFISYSAETGIFTVSFAIADAQGNILKETCFDVKRINAGKK